MKIPDELYSRVLWLLKDVSDNSNWKIMEEYGPYGEFYVQTWTGDPQVINEAKEILMDMENL